jgi:hypothetical protein
VRHHEHAAAGCLVKDRDLDLGAAGVVGAHHGDLVLVGHVGLGVGRAGRVVPLARCCGGVVVDLELDVVVAGLVADLVEVELDRVDRGLIGFAIVSLS